MRALPIQGVRICYSGESFEIFFETSRDLDGLPSASGSCANLHISVFGTINVRVNIQNADQSRFPPNTLQSMVHSTNIPQSSRASLPSLSQDVDPFSGESHPIFKRRGAGSRGRFRAEKNPEDDVVRPSRKRATQKRGEGRNLLLLEATFTYITTITVLQYSTIRLIPLPPPPRPPQSQQQVGRPSPPRQAPHKAEETLELLSSNIKQGSGKTEYKQYLYQYCYTM